MSLPVYACPFCGGGRLGILQVGPIPGFSLVCGSCGCHGPMAGGPELAIQLWNRAERPKPDVPIPGPPPPPTKVAPQPVAVSLPGRRPLRFCGADTLLSEPDGSVSVKRGDGCSCPKEGA